MMKCSFGQMNPGTYFRSALTQALFVKRTEWYAEPILMNGLADTSACIEFDNDMEVHLLDSESEWPVICYRDEIRAWNWDKIKDGVNRDLHVDHDNDDQVIGTSWIGTTIGVMPSGKIYAMWTSNQTAEDVNRDAYFNTSLEEVVNEIGGGLFVDWGESGDLFISKVFTYEEVATKAGFEIAEYCGQYCCFEAGDKTNSGLPFETEEEAWKDCCIENRLVEK